MHANCVSCNILLAECSLSHHLDAGQKSARTASLTAECSIKDGEVAQSHKPELRYNTMDQLVRWAKAALVS